MKVREGFVSNSSSTSFLVAWDKRVTKLADVKKYIDDPEQARLLFSWMKEQGGLYLCTPPKPECEDCKERFRCYTGGGKVEELAKLIRGGGGAYEDDDYDEENRSWSIEKAIEFFDENKGRVAYCFRIADFGEGAESEAEANMRHGEVFDGVIPYDAWE